MLRRLAPCLLACFLALAGASHAARAGQCGLPDTSPLWIDYGDAAVRFWKEVFARPGLILATSGPAQAQQVRAAGAQTVFYDLHLNDRVGTPSVPADPATIEDKANRLFDFAAASSGCSTPLIAENELAGAFTTTPWSATNAQYRANVLAFLRALAARGARPFLLIPTPPYTGGEAADWWRQVAQVSDVVREVFPDNEKEVSQPGPLLGSRNLREEMRQLVRDFTTIGIPPSRLGLLLEFEPGSCCRAGLPASAWFEVVKLQALAAHQVASELGISSIWSWGWATFGAQAQDPATPAAACVYLWARDQGLCDGPARAGPSFDASLTEGQLVLPSGVHCSLQAGQIGEPDITQLAALTGDRELASSALLERLVQTAKVEVDPSQVLAAERAVIAIRFRGRRASYLSALARTHATVPIARAVLADELRGEQIEATFRVGSPSAAAIAQFYGNYGRLLTRAVEAVPAPRWLGGRTKGLAIASLAPARVFGLPSGRSTSVPTLEGIFSVRPLGEALPLADLPLAVARPAIAAALVRLAQEDAYQAWVLKRETDALQGVICLEDDIPAVGAVDLTTYLPFLAPN